MSIIIVGGGEIGATRSNRLSAEGKDVVLIERSDERVRQLRDVVDVHVIHGSGSNPRTLKEAGLDEADMLIAVTSSDEVNLVACLAAQQLSVIPAKIARVRDPDLALVSSQFFGDDELDLNINPEEEAAQQVLRTLRVPGAVGVFEFADGVEVFAEVFAHLAADGGATGGEAPPRGVALPTCRGGARARP